MIADHNKDTKETKSDGGKEDNKLTDEQMKLLRSLEAKILKKALQ